MYATFVILKIDYEVDKPGAASVLIVVLKTASKKEGGKCVGKGTENALSQVRSPCLPPIISRIR